MVGDSDIADVNALTDKTLSILGKKLGTTRVSIYGESKKLIGVFDVEVSYDTSALSAELTRRFPTSKLRVSVGQRPPPADRHGHRRHGARPGLAGGEAVRSGDHQFGPGRAAPAGHARGSLRRSLAPGRPRTGRAVERAAATRSRGWLSRQHRRRTPGASAAGHGGRRQASTRSPAHGAVAGIIGSATAPFGFLAGSMVAKGLQVDVMLSALEERGLARRLAEPNLVALSGDTANFLAGGEYPIPVPGLGSGQIAVEYKQYGVSLAFTPTVLRGNLINLKIEPEVSELDPSHSVAIGAGIVVPALTVRRATRRSSSRTARASCSPACCRTICRPRSSNCLGSATCRCSARCSRASPTRRTRPTLSSS